MVYYDNSFERDDDIGQLSAMSTIGSWRRKGLTILLSAILLLLAVFVVVVLFNNMDSDLNTETEEEQKVCDLRKNVLFHYGPCDRLYPGGRSRA